MKADLEDGLPHRALSRPVLALELLQGAFGPLGALFQDMAQQFSPGQVGTLHVYFDDAGALHLHLHTPVSDLRPIGSLDNVPVGHLPASCVCPAGGAGPARAKHLMASLPASTDPNAPAWKAVVRALAELHETASTDLDAAPEWVATHRRTSEPSNELAKTIARMKRWKEEVDALEKAKNE